MPASHIAFAVAIAAAVASPAFAADRPHGACLNRMEQRDAVAQRRAVPLAQVVHMLRSHGRRAELVRARLCRHDGRLHYVLTLLSHNGKVSRLTVDAANGEPIN